MSGDKRLILGLIEDAMGVARFNAEMQEKLLQCMRLTVAAAIARGCGARLTVNTESARPHPQPRAWQ